MHARHEKVGLAPDQATIGAQVLGLDQVVRLFLELSLDLGDDARDIHFDWQNTCCAQEHGHVVHVAADAPGHAGILDFQGELPPVPGDGPVHLADGGGRGRLVVERFEPRLPALAVFASQDAAYLATGHAVRRITERGEGIGEFPGQDVRALHRQHLSHFHRRPAHAGQAPRQFFGIGGGQKHVDRVVRGHPAQAADSLGHAADGQFAGREAESDQPAQACRGHPGLGGRFAVAHGGILYRDAEINGHGGRARNKRFGRRAASHRASMWEAALRPIEIANSTAYRLPAAAGSPGPGDP